MKLKHLIFLSIFLTLAESAVRLISPHLMNYNEIPKEFSSELFKHGDFQRYLDENTIDTASDLKTVRLYGDSTLGYYYINLFFGSQFHKESLIVDTGSTITAIPCTSCSGSCGKNHFNSFFDTGSSNTYKSFKNGESDNNYRCQGRECSFGISYTEGSSYSGYYGRDFISFGNELDDALQPSNSSRLQTDTQLSRVFSTFGCITRETKLFYSQQADGILGLGIATNVYDHPPTFIQSRHIENKNISDSFSICYAFSGGYLTVGGYNSAYHNSDEKPAYVPFHTEHGQYRVTLKKIEFEGSDLEISERTLNFGQGAFFDSGTTLMYTVSETYNKIMGKINEHCGKPGNCGKRASESNCFMYEEGSKNLYEFLQGFPTFTFYFGDIQAFPYELRGEDYMYEQYPGSNKFCIGIEMFSDRTILGGTFMRNHDILFDKEKGIVGFVRSNCSAVSHITIPEIIPGIIDSIENSKNGTFNYWPSDKEANKNLWFLNILLVLAIAGGIFSIYLCVRSKPTHTQIYDEEANRDVDNSTEVVNPNHFELPTHDDEEEEDGNDDRDEKDAAENESNAQTFN